MSFAFDGGTSRSEAVTRLATAFAEAGLDDPRLDARLLVCAAAGINHSQLVRDPDRTLDAASITLNGLVARRLAREPVTRIIGARGFWTLDLTVGPNVLDPRPDSETLIEAALDLFRARAHAPLRIVDLGTGSGALACALLEIFPNGHCVAIDLSAEACALARANIAKCGFSARADVRHGDWATLSPGPYDLIISNPPYIRSADIDGLDPEVRLHDPRLALDGGADGLTAYRQLATLIPAALAQDGAAILEVGHDQADAVSGIFQAVGLSRLSVRRDLSGIERAVIARR